MTTSEPSNSSTMEGPEKVDKSATQSKSVATTTQFDTTQADDSAFNRSAMYHIEFGRKPCRPQLSQSYSAWPAFSAPKGTVRMASPRPALLTETHTVTSFCCSTHNSSNFATTVASVVFSVLFFGKRKSLHHSDCVLNGNAKE